MEVLNKICQTVLSYYQDSNSVYSTPRQLMFQHSQLSIAKNDPQFIRSTFKEIQLENIVNVDLISNSLSCIQTEYKKTDGYYRDVFGIICTENEWKIVCLLTSVTPQRFSPIRVNQTDQVREISELLLRYCHDVYRMDAEDCLSLFQQGARMYHPNEDGSFTDVDIQVLRQRWENMPDPVECGVVEFSRIYHIELLGPDVAVAKIGCAKLYQYFNDYLWLMKLNNEWKIVNKMTQCLYDSKKQTDRG